MRYLRWLAVVAVLAAFPAAALAHRGPTHREKAGVSSALDRYLNKQIPSRCAHVTVSTADTSWAEVYVDGRPSGCRRYAIDGVAFFHHRDGRWRFVSAGSSFRTPNGGCKVPKVPLKVVRDLGLCRNG